MNLIFYLCRIGLSGDTKQLTYEKFLKAFQEGRKDNYKPKSEDHQYPQTDNAHLSPEKAEEKMKAQMTKKHDLLKAVSCVIMIYINIIYYYLLINLPGYY